MQNDGLRNLIEDIIHELVRGLKVIGRIGDAEYTRASARTGSVGAQFRHNLDLVNSLLRDLPTGRIDYERRERDPLIETDRRYAAAKFEAAILKLRSLVPVDLKSVVHVRSESDSGLLHLSTAAREMEFVLSHTIHHHALIAEKLAAVGVTVDREFGVAPSTLRYWRSAERLAA